MNDIDGLLHQAFTDLADGVPHHPDLAAAVRRRSHRRQWAVIAPIAAALAVIAVTATVLITRPGSGTSTGTGPTATACRPVISGVLPTWARTGFTDPEPQMSYVTSATGELIAILFVPPLVSPPSPDYNNKILWVTSSSDFSATDNSLHLSGRLEGGTATMTATVDGGPGPSIIDVPVAGCWTFDLTWGTHHDSIALLYSKP